MDTLHAFHVLIEIKDEALCLLACQFLVSKPEVSSLGHKVASKVPVRGFYRIRTAEKNLDLLFVAILAFARSGAADDKGGTFGMLKGTLRG